MSFAVGEARKAAATLVSNPRLWDVIELGDVAGPDHIELMAVEGCELHDPMTLRQCDGTCVGGAEGQARVLLHQFGAAVQISHGQISHNQEAGTERADELGFHRRTGITSQQIGHLGHDQARYEPRCAGGGERPQRRLVTRVASVGGGHQRAFEKS
jgi:hypothetical protein